MTLCRNCGWQPDKARGLCGTCHEYERTNSQPRPASVVLRHLNRTIDRNNRKRTA